VDLTYFFRGMLDHEVSASAYFAMMLDGSSDFRRSFLRHVLHGAPGIEGQAWKVDVEVNQVDVSMRSQSWLVLIENKIQGGSVQDQQLARYYASARAIEPADRRIAAVWLAPKGIGLGQVAAARTILEAADVVAHVSWEVEVRGWVEKLPNVDNRTLAESGLREVLRIIEVRRRGLAGTDERLEVRRIAARALQVISATRPDLSLLTWRGKDFEQLLVPKTSPFSLILMLGFKEAGAPEHEPLTLMPDGRRHVTLRTQFRRGTTVEPGSPLGVRWREHDDAFEISGIGQARRGLGATWFEWSEDVIETSEAIADRWAHVGLRTIEALEEFCSGPK